MKKNEKGMALQPDNNSKIQIGFRQGLAMVLPYAGKKILEQIRSVWLIIIYLVLFLRVVLGVPLDDAAMIGLGLAGVILGLSLFMEGLLLGLMPLGEVIGLKLPRRSGLPAILVFALILGIGATFAEPAIGVLKAAGSAVLPWEAPLLYVLLNRYAAVLVYAVAAGVGIAVMLGTLRFLYGWSLKPFIYLFVGMLSALTLAAAVDPNMRHIIGLAWDCGAVTTGPVTVPLVLALGIGICRASGRTGAGNSGFGVVTLASLLPIIAVLLLGMILGAKTPSPMPESRFFHPENRNQTAAIFSDITHMRACAFENAHEATQALLFEGGQLEMLDYLRGLKDNEVERKAVFGSHPEALFRWAVEKGSEAQRLAVFDAEDAVSRAMTRYARQSSRPAPMDLLQRNTLAAVRAIIPLALFLAGVLLFVIKDRIPRADEILLGVMFALAGMMLFGIGIETGLGKIGNQTGSKLPVLFKSIPMPEQRQVILVFDPAMVQTAVAPNGGRRDFFFIHQDGAYSAVPFDAAYFDAESGRYTHIPEKGPLYGREITGLIVLLLFAFVMGYGATLAEPALNALGHTVEEVSVGTFKKSLLMHSVALGVGTGIALGMARIVWDLPLYGLLVPPYLLLLALTWMSTEEFVNIGWDSAGVTTGPVTVPLVLALGLGIGGQVGVIEGFGILAMASVCPILIVLLVGLYVTRQRKADILRTARATRETAS